MKAAESGPFPPKRQGQHRAQRERGVKARNDTTRVSLSPLPPHLVLLALVHARHVKVVRAQNALRRQLGQHLAVRRKLHLPRPSVLVIVNTMTVIVNTMTVIVNTMRSSGSTQRYVSEGDYM